MNFCTTNAQRLSQQYDSLSPEQVHADWRDIGQKTTAKQSVRWLDDTLPQLSAISYQLSAISASYNSSFRLILASAMWMHLTPGA